MVVSPKEDSFVVVEIGSYTVKALIDTTDVNKLPTVNIRTRAGVLKQLSTANDATVGSKDEKMDVEDVQNEPTKIQNDSSGQRQQSSGADMDVDTSAPADNEQANNAESSQADENTAAIDEASGKDATNADDNPEGSKAGSDASYVFGNALDALETAGDETLESIVDVIPNGFVKDWDALSGLLRHVLTRELGIRIIDNNCPILFSVPPLWPKSDLESLTQIAFEHLNVPSILITEQPLMAIFGNNTVNGVVIDFGHTSTTVSPIIESCIQASCIQQSSVAGAAVTAHLHRLLQSSAEVKAQFEGADIPEEFAAVLKESGLCKFQSSIAEDNASDKGASEPASFEFKGKRYAIGEHILASAPEILFSTDCTETMSLTALIKHAILGCEVDKRNLLWESIHVVGGSSQFPGLKDHLQRALESTVLPASNAFANSQTREIRFASIPDYFSGWRNRDHMAAFLGASITAKIALGDSKYNITRSDYNESGPSIIHTKSY
ncbi:hypothetical protein GGI12_003479 [Dipsacomyces acuminosporus]|nr:hypothetical protein GGI12_003479 [Dipsacomyces acuminosporus]